MWVLVVIPELSSLNRGEVRSIRYPFITRQLSAQQVLEKTRLLPCVASRRSRSPVNSSSSSRLVLPFTHSRLSMTCLILATHCIYYLRSCSLGHCAEIAHSLVDIARTIQNLRLFTKGFIGYQILLMVWSFSAILVLTFFRSLTSSKQQNNDSRLLVVLTKQFLKGGALSRTGGTNFGRKVDETECRRVIPHGEKRKRWSGGVLRQLGDL